MLRHLTLQQLLRLCGQHDSISVQDKVKLVEEFYLRHGHGLSFGLYMIYHCILSIFNKQNIYRVVILALILISQERIC